MLSIGTIYSTKAKIHVPASKIANNTISLGNYTTISKWGDATLSDTLRTADNQVARLWGQSHSTIQPLQKPLVLNFGRVDKSKTLSLNVWNLTDTPTLTTINSDIQEIASSLPTALPAHSAVVLPVVFVAGSRLKVSEALVAEQTTKVIASVGKVWLGSSWVEGVSLAFYTAISGSPVGVEQRTPLREDAQVRVKACLYGKTTQVYLFAKKAGTTPVLIARTDQVSEAVYYAGGTVLSVGGSSELEGKLFAWEQAGESEMGLGMIGTDGFLRLVKGVGGMVVGAVVKPALVSPVKAVVIDTFGDAEYQGDFIKLSFNAIELE